MKKLLFLFVFLFFLNPLIIFAATVESVSNSGVDTGHSSLSFYINITSGNVLFAGCSFYGSGTGSVTSFTHNSVNMTQIGAIQQDNNRVELYRRVSPDAGSLLINVAVSGTWDFAICGAVSIAGGDISTPNGTVVTNSHGYISPATVSVSSANGEVAIALISSSSMPITAATGPIEQWRGDGSGASINAGGVGATYANQTTANFSWPLGQSNPWVVIGVSAKAGAGGGSASGNIVFRRRGQ